MKIITASNGKMNEILDVALAMNRRLGYVPQIITPPKEYDDYTFGEWPERIRGKSPYKPEIILKAVQNTSHPIAWLDADAFCVKPIEPAFDHDFDIAVTVRRRGEIKHIEHHPQYGYINAGVLFFKPSSRTVKLLRQWIARVKETESRSDQEALTTLLRESDELTKGNKTFRHQSSGAVVHTFTTDEYNWFYWPESVPETARILHMKRGKRERGLAWAKQQLCERV